jgi:hypothetical protein
MWESISIGFSDNVEDILLLLMLKDDKNYLILHKL